MGGKCTLSLALGITSNIDQMYKHTKVSPVHTHLGSALHFNMECRSVSHQLFSFYLRRHWYHLEWNTKLINQCTVNVNESKQLTLKILARETPLVVKSVMMWNVRYPLLPQKKALPFITCVKASSVDGYTLYILLKYWMKSRLLKVVIKVDSKYE